MTLDGFPARHHNRRSKVEAGCLLFDITAYVKVEIGSARGNEIVFGNSDDLVALPNQKRLQFKIDRSAAIVLCDNYARSGQKESVPRVLDILL